MTSMCRLLVLALLLMTSGLAGRRAEAADGEDRWAAFRPLLGEWTGEGGGQPGQGAGRLSHSLDLDGRILIRKNHVEYPATKDRPAFAHDDLLITYFDEARTAAKAIYWDNEGHAIQYSVSVLTDGRTLVYTSEPSPAGPRFRFIYAIETPDRMRLKFEIAPPGKPDAFGTYSEGVVKRVK